MSKYWNTPSPTLVVNDETMEFVMAHNITRVVVSGKGSVIYTRSDSSIGVSKINSPLSPKELHRRLFDL